MFRRSAALGAAVAAAVPLLTAGGATAATHHSRTSRSVIGALIPTHRSEVLPRRGGTADSLNWSGYAVTPGSGITAVDSTFTVPSIASVVPPGFTANWTGIGGYNSSDLIQAGTSEQTAPSNPLLGNQYYAWYEILPASETQLTGCTGDANCTVTPGDIVNVSISNAGTNLWTISMTDQGHWSWSKTISYTSSESSAEWIEEAPEVGTYTIPANTGTSYFGPVSTYTDAAGTHTIAAGDPTTIDESPIGIVNEATPSALASDGQSFNDCAYAQSCPTP